MGLFRSFNVRLSIEINICSGPQVLSRPTLLTESNKAPNLFTFIYVQKLKANLLITKRFKFGRGGNLLPVLCKFALEYLKNAL